MISFAKLQRVSLECVHNPVFNKPIEVKDYSKKGEIKLITKIKHNEQRP